MEERRTVLSQPLYGLERMGVLSGKASRAVKFVKKAEADTPSLKPTTLMELHVSGRLPSHSEFLYMH